MKPAGKKFCQSRRGAALIISMIFVLIFSALAVSMATISGTNLQLANNQHKVNLAFASAESGLEVIRFWVDGIYIPGYVSESGRFNYIASNLQNELAAKEITNVITDYNGSNLITIPTVAIDSQRGQSFDAAIEKINNDVLQLEVTGYNGNTRRKIIVQYHFYERANPVFDFGIGTKGPLAMTGNVDLSGANVDVESSVYIEALSAETALSLQGNCSIAGDVSIVDPYANVELSNPSSIGGQSGQDAIDNHVFRDAPFTEFPYPNTGYFEQYVGLGEEYIIDGDVSADVELANIRIAAGSNPTFSGNVNIKGIIFIEQPNIVTFTGNVDITGLIIGNGNTDSSSESNQINFTGSVLSHSVENLPATAEFAGIKDEVGTFLLAPGFSVSMGGSFDTLNGTIAANGIEFYGQAGGTISGTVINYSNTVMTLTGNSDLVFNRSGTTKCPAGFEPEMRLDYVPSSYREVF